MPSFIFLEVPWTLQQSIRSPPLWRPGKMDSEQPCPFETQSSVKGEQLLKDPTAPRFVFARSVTGRREELKITRQFTQKSIGESEWTSRFTPKFLPLASESLINQVTLQKTLVGCFQVRCEVSSILATVRERLTTSALHPDGSMLTPVGDVGKAMTRAQPPVHPDPYRSDEQHPHKGSGRRMPDM